MNQKKCAQNRMQNLRAMLRQEGLDGYVMSTSLEQYYVSGIRLLPGEAVFLITPRQAYCFTKKLIVTKVQPACFIKVKTVPLQGMLEGALAFIKEKKLKRVAFDPTLVSSKVGGLLKKAGCVERDSFIVGMRMRKQIDEQAKLKKACQIAARAFEEVQPQIKTGMTEEDVRVLMAVAMHKHGADSVPFNIVSFGENTADVHHTPSKTRKLKKNEAVLLDFGCFYEGYTSDMTRSWWHGDKEPVAYTKAWKLVENAYRAGVKALRGGVRAGDIDKASRQVIEKAGYGKEFFHTTGHGIGLEIHEAPTLCANSSAPLKENFAVTVEPGVYFIGKWGIRLEDSFLVTKTGSKKLTKK